MYLDNLHDEFVLDRVAGYPMIHVKNVSCISDLQYKLMKRNQLSGLTDCRQMKINGKFYLVYMPGNKVNLDEIGRTLTSKEYISVICSFMSCLNDIYDSGYLKIENVILDKKNIYVERNSGNIGIIYLPVDLQAPVEEIVVKQIKEFLASAIACSHLENTFEGQICSNFLKEKDAGFHETAEFVRDAFSHVKNENDRNNGTVILESMSALHSIKILIAENKYTIGRYFQTTNGKMERIDTISKEHCKIIKENSRVYVVDLHSTNGTFLNGKQLLQEKKYEMHSGDVLSIANIPFQVKIKGIRY